MIPRSKCPVCDRPIIRSPENRWRPFCSERCQLIDLGAWFDGRHRIIDQASSGHDGEPWERGTEADSNLSDDD